MYNFSETYPVARDKFMYAAMAANADVKSYPHPLKGAFGEGLYTDVAWVGPKDAKNVIVTCSGMHGVEGYAGSACQNYMMDEVSYGRLVLPENTAVLHIHAINPWGFSHGRRVNENGVDVNRNFVDFDNIPKDEGYTEIADAMVNEDWRARGGTLRVISTYVKQMSQKKNVTRAATGGQYTNPEGIYYGGTEREWSNLVMEKILKEHLSEADRIGYIDLHTGMGDYEELSILHNYTEEDKQSHTMKSFFPRHRFEVLTESVMQQESLNGENVTFFEDFLSDKVIFTSSIEFGTQKCHKRSPLWAGVNLISTLCEEHSLYLVAKDIPEILESAYGKKVKSNLREIFNPNDEEWQEIVLFESNKMWRGALNGFHDLDRKRDAKLKQRRSNGIPDAEVGSSALVVNN
jgi:hypothetical protein